MQKKTKQSSGVETDFLFTSKLWKYNGPAGWFFVTIPADVSRRIRETHFASEEGWGRLRTTASIGESSWKTAIWFDSKFNAYLLPIKSSIRKKENIELDEKVTVSIKFEFEVWFKNSLLRR